MLFNNNLITFADGNTDFFEAFAQYYNNKDMRTSENSKKIQDAFFSMTEKKSGFTREALGSAWATNPTVQWASMAVIDALINVVLPDVLAPSLSTFAEVKNVNYGDVLRFRVKPKTLFHVTKTAMGERTTFRQKAYDGYQVLDTEVRIVTVYTDYLRVLKGLEDVAEFIRLVVYAIEREINLDAITAISTQMQFAQTISTPTVDQILVAADAIRAYDGCNVAIMGTQPALQKVGALAAPSTSGYRITVADGKIEMINTAFGIPFIVVPNVASNLEWNSGNPSLALPTNEAWIVGMDGDKPIKIALSTEMANQELQNADLTSNFTYRKGWGVGSVVQAQNKHCVKLTNL